MHFLCINNNKQNIISFTGTLTVEQVKKYTNKTFNYNCVGSGS